MNATVITYTPYALGMAAVTDAVLNTARQTLSYGLSDTGWVELMNVDHDPAFVRGIDHALKQRLERPDLRNYMHRPPYYPDRLQVWLCSTAKEYARIVQLFEYEPPARL
ncbi:MAG: hypothetical protein EON60_07920 [Alphaproteobacteria bacterium]|nr:MAG: hypothetical protein EON60_07920 [Alphaproteobacteria bacterium]